MFPTQTVVADTVVELGGLQLRVQNLGPGESPADSVWFLDGSTVFCGDVAYNQTHSYLADGYFEQWLATLSRLAHDLAADATLHIGQANPAA